MKHINYAIFQLREDIEDNSLIRYSLYSVVQEKGLRPTINRYQEVYRDTEENDEDTDTLLEKLFKKFNFSKPADFEGRNLSVSDVVELDLNGKKAFYYVDSIGFQKLEDFDSEEVEYAPYQKQIMNRFCRKE